MDVISTGAVAGYDGDSMDLLPDSHELVEVRALRYLLDATGAPVCLRECHHVFPGYSRTGRVTEPVVMHYSRTWCPQSHCMDSKMTALLRHGYC